jgi:hypothetical protein
MPCRVSLRLTGSSAGERVGLWLARFLIAGMQMRRGTAVALPRSKGTTMSIRASSQERARCNQGAQPREDGPREDERRPGRNLHSDPTPAPDPSPVPDPNPPSGPMGPEPLPGVIPSRPAPGGGADPEESAPHRRDGGRTL